MQCFRCRGVSLALCRCYIFQQNKCKNYAHNRICLMLFFFAAWPQEPDFGRHSFATILLSVWPLQRWMFFVTLFSAQLQWIDNNLMPNYYVISSMKQNPTTNNEFIVVKLNQNWMLWDLKRFDLISLNRCGSTILPQSEFIGTAVDAHTEKLHLDEDEHAQ